MGTNCSISGVYQHCNILENQNNLKLCSICLENLNENEGTKAYVCSHLYHRECINNWRGNCPMCRANRLPTSLRIINLPSSDINSNTELPSITDESIEGFKRCHQRVPTNFHNIYHQKWKKNDCVRYNHNLVFLRPYGVVGICEDCKIIQCFSLSHAI